MVLFVGDDWAEDHHDKEVLDESGRRLAKARLPEGMTGVARLHELLAEHLDEDSISAETGTLATGQVAEGFGRHPDAEIYLSQAGLGTVLGARVLAEFGDGPQRYRDHKAAATTPAPQRSPAPPGAGPSCSPATPATAASATRSTNGRSAR